MISGVVELKSGYVLKLDVQYPCAILLTIFSTSMVNAVLNKLVYYCCTDAILSKLTTLTRKGVDSSLINDNAHAAKINNYQDPKIRNI